MRRTPFLLQSMMRFGEFNRWSLDTDLIRPWKIRPEWNIASGTRRTVLVIEPLERLGKEGQSPMGIVLGTGRNVVKFTPIFG